MTEYSPYDLLKLDNQLCFPLYACSKEIVRRYTPILDRIGLTYTQYIAMMVLWEERQMGVGELGERLFLDSGTLTPLLKKLESKGLVTRTRSESDERKVLITLTDAGLELREKALMVPSEIGNCITLDPQDAMDLYRILHKMMGSFRE